MDDNEGQCGAGQATSSLRAVNEVAPAAVRVTSLG